MTYAEAHAQLERSGVETKLYGGQENAQVLAPTRRYSNADPDRQQPPPTQEVCDLVAYCNMAARVNR
eukprot:2613457-Lingulodinium_polyedra.AAC.1